MELYYAVKPLGINQKFGLNPDYYAKLGWKGHNGIDFMAAHATPLYGPCDGYARYVEDSHGGDGIYIHHDDGKGYFYNIILWHLCSKTDLKYRPLIPLDGSSVLVRAGQLIGYTDNSGAPFESSGDHLHFGLQPCDIDGHALNSGNGFGGCIDPLPFFNGKFAQDIPTEEAIVQKSAQVIKLVATSDLPHADKFDILKKVEELIKSLL